MICIDSDCLIDFLRGKESAIEITKKYKGELYTTEINVFEVFFGIYFKDFSKKKEDSARELFNSMNIFPLKKGWGKQAAKIHADLSKKGEIIDQDDIFIASIMLKNECSQIITNNNKHFSKIKGISTLKY